MIDFFKNIELYDLLIIIAIFLIAFLIYLSDYIKKRKCSKCKSFLHTKLLTKATMGEHFGNEYYQDFRVIYKCKKCNHTWLDTDTETYGSS